MNRTSTSTGLSPMSSPLWVKLAKIAGVAAFGLWTVICVALTIAMLFVGIVAMLCVILLFL